MKIATIGTGFIVDSFMDACIKNKVELVAMYSRNKENATTLSNKYNIELIYTNLEEMLQNPIIDFIYIASPNSLHYEQAKLALEHNKHVICEKPFTSTSKELEKLTKLATTKRLFLFEAITTLYLPHLNEIQKEIKNIEPIHMVQCNFSKYSSRYNDFKLGLNPNIFNPMYSGGALMDLNIYNLHYVLTLFGFPNESNYVAYLEDNGIDTSGTVTLQYSDKIILCSASKNSDSPSLSFIQGEKGYIQTSSVGGLHETIICTNKTKKLDLHHDLNNLYYEVKSFKEMFEQSNLDACYKNLMYSNKVIKLVEKLRKDAGIIFTADKE